MGSIRAGSALNWRWARQMWPSQPGQALEDCGTSEVTIEVKMMLLLLSVSGSAQMVSVEPDKMRIFEKTTVLLSFVR